MGMREPHAPAHLERVPGSAEVYSGTHGKWNEIDGSAATRAYRIIERARGCGHCDDGERRDRFHPAERSPFPQ